MLSVTAEQEIEAAMLEITRRHHIGGAIVKTYFGTGTYVTRVVLTPGIEMVDTRVRKKICPSCLEEDFDD